MSHEKLFGHLVSDNFTAQEATEYLEVSMSTFRHFVASGKLNPSSTVGGNQMFSVADLKAFKKALKLRMDKSSNTTRSRSCAQVDMESIQRYIEAENPKAATRVISLIASLLHTNPS